MQMLSCPNDLNIHRKAYTMWAFRTAVDFSALVKDLTVCDQDLLSFISKPLSTVNLCLLPMHTRTITGCGSAKIPQANIHPKCPIMLVLLLFLPVSFILSTASGTCLDLILLRHAHSIPDCKSAYKNGPYKRYQQAQSERKLRLLWKCDRF